MDGHRPGYRKEYYEKHEKTPEAKAKRKAYFRARYQAKATEILAKQKARAQTPEAKAKRRAYDAARHASRDYVKEARRERDRRNLARYGTTTPEKGMTAIDGSGRRYGMNGPRPMPKPKMMGPKPKQPKVKTVKPVQTFSTGVKRVEPVAPERPAGPRKPPWIPKPVNTEIIRIDRKPTIYLCERGTCKRTFTSSGKARQHFKEIHSHE